MKRIAYLLSLVLLLPFFGCTKDSEKYIAIVNDSKIERQKFDFITDKQIKQIEKMGHTITPDQKYGIQKMLLDKMVAIELLVQEAKKANITTSDDDVNKKFDAIKAQYPNKDDFDKLLKENGLTEAEIRSEMKKNIIIDTLLEKEIVGKIQIDDADVKKFYDDNKERFQVPDQVRASHILLKIKAQEGTPEADKESKENKAKLAAIRKDIIDKKKDFATAAKEFSDCPSKDKGGDLGFFSKDRMIPEFTKVAFSLKPGTISEPFKTNFGYHIMMVADKRTAHQRSYDEVKGDIKQVLIRQKSGIKVQEYVENIKKNAKITSFLKEPAPAAAAPTPAPAGPKQETKTAPAK
jgi:peptidyl-prolyl cis-trans isomerase C